MALATSCTDSSWWVFTVPAFLGSDVLADHSLVLSLFIASISAVLLAWALSSGGPAWANGRSNRGSTRIPGPRGIPVFGSIFSLARGLPHRTLAKFSQSMQATQLMAFSIGSTPAVVSSDPTVAKEILTHPNFADRPLKRSARELMFGRAIGFAPNGTYWRMLRRISSTHLFAPRRIAAHESGRQLDCNTMLAGIESEMTCTGSVKLRYHLQGAALNNIMGCVFGKRYDLSEECADAEVLKQMVREGFDLLGAFNWSDHLPWLAKFFDPSQVEKRCADLVPRVRKLVSKIIDEHRKVGNGSEVQLCDKADFVDVLLSLEGDDKLSEDDMVAVLWEMIFRGTDTTALLTEWAMAELILNPTIQSKLRAEIDSVVGSTGTVTDTDVARMPYLQAVVKETLRVHPPGPLLSWARLSNDDVQLSNGMVVPAGTTAMVNMWAITHDSSIWANADKYDPARFMVSEGGADVDIRGGDLRLAPFGAGRRVCPGKNLGIVTVSLWVARLVHCFEWVPVDSDPIDLSEVLKLSLEMKKPLVASATARN
ncbi:cytochrome P450 78A11 [Carex littledalei]|uniref:Cytochrome P450 78A11 n=1 Tax=Carex littledalei TaxID=544730 RepID=A0A833V6K5_9POAL|nr:cytochrome P450 78A11 [Carex littledalei]